jgi:hypothetical protein
MSPYHRILVIGGSRFRLPPVAQLADILRQAPRAALWRPPGSPCPSRSKEAGYRRALLTETHRRGQARWCAQFQPRFARCLRAVSVARCSHRWCCSSPPMRAERLTSERVAEEDRPQALSVRKGAATRRSPGTAGTSVIREHVPRFIRDATAGGGLAAGAPPPRAWTNAGWGARLTRHFCSGGGVLSLEGQADKPSLEGTSGRCSDRRRDRR